MTRPYDYMRLKPGPQSITLIREAMRTLALDLNAGRIHTSVAAAKLQQLADSTKRKPAVSRAPRRIRPLSEHAREQVRDYHRANPTYSQLELARTFNTNPGRISEALNEFRT